MRKKVVKLYILNHYMGRVELLSALVIYLSPYIYYCFGEGVAALWILDTTLYYWHLCFLETHKMNVCTLMFWAPECSLEIEDQNIGFYRKLLSSCLIFSLRSYLTLCLFKKSKDGSFYLPLICFHSWLFLMVKLYLLKNDYFGYRYVLC